MNLLTACIQLNIPLDAVRSQPINMILDMIDTLSPQEEVEKKRVTAKDVQDKKEIEYKIWQI